MELVVPSGKTYQVRQLNALDVALLLKQFPALDGEDKAVRTHYSVDELIQIGEYQRDLIIAGVISPAVTKENYSQIDGPDADALSAFIGGSSKTTGPEVKQASSFRTGSADGADLGRAGAEIPQDTVGVDRG